ncbi:hypothetical protein Cgig2_015748 [Carnegiea gigantea]|uniref:Uncharacterized protein n=1 Tax=Carnegiea gigantea TaxID=171969 RepID=A0A9Q1JPI6_9CARY|nr:hypothetical protein Cgig2_015748 [Carnegiea gigantea]
MGGDTLTSFASEDESSLDNDYPHFPCNSPDGTDFFKTCESDGNLGRRKIAYNDIMKNYDELGFEQRALIKLRDKSSVVLNDLLPHLFRYTPGSWIMMWVGRTGQLCHTKNDHILACWSKRIRKSSLVNRISRVFEDDKFASEEPSYMDADSSSLKMALKCKAHRVVPLPVKIRKVNFVIFVVNGFSALRSMNSDKEEDKDDKPVVAVTHGDFLSLKDRARVRIYLGEKVGRATGKADFDIPAILLGIACAVFPMLHHGLQPPLISISAGSHSKSEVEHPYEHQGSFMPFPSSLWSKSAVNNSQEQRRCEKQEPETTSPSLLASKYAVAKSARLLRRKSNVDRHHNHRGSHSMSSKSLHPKSKVKWRKIRHFMVGR